MPERILIAAIIIALGAALYWTWARAQLWRVRRTHAQTPGLETLDRGHPAILYFTAPDCVPCRTVQIPALEKLQAEFGKLQVIKIDASETPSIADYWGVLSVPTTFIIDSQGRPRRVNHGVASAAKLRQQLQEIGEWRSEIYEQQSHRDFLRTS